MITENKYIPLNKSWYVKTEPATEPITVDELKTFARIDGDDEDTLLAEIITSVRKNIELYLGRSLIEQTFTLTMNYWPSMVVELPMAPLRSIVQVYTIDENGVETEYDSSSYYAITSTTPGRLVLKSNSSFPVNDTRDYSGYAIEYKAGYGTLTTDVPSSILNALKMWATIVYETRAVVTTPPDNIKFELDLFKVINI